MVSKLASGQKLKLFAGTLFLLLAGFSLSSGKVFADCGVHTGVQSDYAGLTVGVSSTDDSNVTGYGNVDIIVSTYGKSFTNQNGSENSSGNGGYNLLENQGDGNADTNYNRKASATFVPQSGETACTGNDHGVVLGYTGDTPDVNGIKWMLDCDVSLRAEPGGPQLDTSAPYQEFTVQVTGTPSGLRSGGYWTVSDNFDSGNNDTEDSKASQTGSQSNPNPSPVVAPANGNTAHVSFVYNEPPPQPQQNPPEPSDNTIRCDVFSYGGGSVTIGSGKNAHSTPLYGQIDLAGATIDSAYINSSDGTEWEVDPGTNTAYEVVKNAQQQWVMVEPEVARSPSSFVSSDTSDHDHLINSINASLIPNAQTVSVSIAEYYYDGSNWDYYDTISPAPSVQCYRAECSIQSVVGGLAGGYIGNGGKVTITANVTNESNDPEFNNAYTNLAIPQTDGAGNSLVIHTDQGDSGGFSVPSNGTTSVTFTITAPTSGTSGSFSGGVEYNNGDFWVSGKTDCSGSYPIYQAPLVNIDNAICGSSSPTLNGWAFAQNGDQPYSIAVTVYVGGPAGTGTLLGPGDPGLSKGVYGTNVYRGDVDAYYGISGTHGFSIAIPTSYQDGQNHTFYVYANDPNGIYGIENEVPATYTMTGCESFSLTPGVSSTALNPNAESPSSFSGTASVAVKYYDGATGTSSSTYNYPNFPGVQASVPYTITKNGVVQTSGSVPSPSGNGRFNDTSSTPSLAIPTGSFTYGDTYCLNVSADPLSGYVQNDGTTLSVTNAGPDTQTGCKEVVDKPFFKVYNGGISAGGSFGCSGAGGELASWNNNSGTQPSGGDYGASAELNVRALLNIVGVASAQTGFGRSPTDLTFANTTNTTTDTYSPTLGGAFDTSGNDYCLTDETPPPSGATVVTDPHYTVFGGDAQTIDAGSNDAIFVTGDAYIANNIVYDQSGWSVNTADDSSNVPSFVLHVTGNIFISPNVTELDGLYIAQGDIYDCSDSVTPNNFAPMPAMKGTVSTIFEYCNNQLKVNGSFVANQVDLMRTFGSLRDETPAPSSTPPTVNTFTASPATITQGDGTKPTIQWTATPGSTCAAGEPGGDWTSSTAASGTQSVTPSATTTYVITCTNANGSDTKATTVTVDKPSAGATAPITWTTSPAGSSCATVPAAEGSGGSDSYICSADSSLHLTIVQGTSHGGQPYCSPPWRTQLGGSGSGWNNVALCARYPVTLDGTTSAAQYCASPPTRDQIGHGGVIPSYFSVCIAAQGASSTATASTDNGSPSTGVTPATTAASITSGADCSKYGDGSWESPVVPGQGTCAAEVFNFSPEMYLSNWNVGDNNTGRWDAVTSLPPVL